MNPHKNCKRRVVDKLARMSYHLNTIKDMIHDDCPAVRYVSLTEITRIQDELHLIEIDVRSRQLE